MAKQTTEETPAEQPRTVVYLGNRNAVIVADDGSRTPHPGKWCTTIVLAAGLTLMDAARDITSAQGVWAAHSDATSPAWVASTDPALAQLLAAHYKCAVREPEPAVEG